MLFFGVMSVLILNCCHSLCSFYVLWLHVQMVSEEEKELLIDMESILVCTYLIPKKHCSYRWLLLLLQDPSRNHQKYRQEIGATVSCL